MGILNILVIVLLIILILIVVILYLGVRISLKYEKTGRNITGFFEILILERIAIFKRQYPSSESLDSSQEVKKPAEEPVESSNDTKYNISKYITIIKESKTILRPLLTLIKSSLKAIEVKKLQNHLILGLPSFTDTIEYVGYLWAFFANTNTLIEGCNLSAVPVFGELKLDGYGEINIKINLIKILPALIRFLIKKEVRNFIKLILKLRKEDSNG